LPLCAFARVPAANLGIARDMCWCKGKLSRSGHHGRLKSKGVHCCCVNPSVASEVSMMSTAGRWLTTKARETSLVGAVRAWECRCLVAQLSLPPQGCFGGTQGSAQPGLCVAQCSAHIAIPDKPTNFLLIFHFYKPRLHDN